MIIKCNKKFLEERCIERRYSLKEVMNCVIEKNNDEWTIDTDHPSYPRKAKPIIRPGLELSKILSIFGIFSSNTCPCKNHASKMDRMELMESGWCMENIDLIVSWMEKEAKNRHLPFSKMVAKALVKLAIYRAKKKANIK
jgi:hypothetical protein